MPWTQRIGEIEGRPAQIVVDDRFKSSAPVRELSRLAWFGVHCQHTPGAAFWNPEETMSLDAVENDLIRLLRSSAKVGLLMSCASPPPAFTMPC